MACWHAGRWPASEGGGQECWHVCAAGVHPSMLAPRSWHAVMLACWHAGRWPASEEGGQECWHVCAAGVHPSMPASPVVGMLAYWLTASQRGRRAKNVGMSVLLGCTPASQTYQHPCRWHAGMLVGGQPVKNTNLSVLLGCTQACRQLGGSMLACQHDGMLVDGHPSSSEEMIVAAL